MTLTWTQKNILPTASNELGKNGRIIKLAAEGPAVVILEQPASSEGCSDIDIDLDLDTDIDIDTDTDTDINTDVDIDIDIDVDRDADMTWT